MIRMPHLTWPQRLAVVAGLTVFGLVGGMELPNADATNAGTAVSSTCGADGRWVVAMSVTSQYDGVIHIRLDDPHGPTPLMELAPFATKTITEHPDTGSRTWTWTWTSTDGHLTGPAVSGTATRPDGCTPPPTSGTTTTTTCAQAIPPRSDCAPTTEVTTSPTVTASTSSAVSNAPAPSTASTVSGVAGTAAGTSIAPTRRNASTSIAPSVLPATGTGSTIVWVAVALLAVGTAAILITVRRRRPS